MTLIVAMKRADGVLVMSDMLLTIEGGQTTVSIPSVGSLSTLEEYAGKSIGVSRLVRKVISLQGFGLLVWSGPISVGRKLQEIAPQYLTGETGDESAFQNVISHLSVDQQREAGVIAVNAYTLSVFQFNCEKFELGPDQYWTGGSGGRQFKNYLQAYDQEYAAYHARQGVKPTLHEIGVSWSGRLLFRETMFSSEQANAYNPQLLHIGAGGFYEPYTVQHLGNQAFISKPPATLHLFMSVDIETGCASIVRLYVYRRRIYDEIQTADVFSFVSKPVQLASDQENFLASEVINYRIRPFEVDGPHATGLWTPDRILEATSAASPRFDGNMDVALASIVTFARVSVRFDDVEEYSLDEQLELIDVEGIQPRHISIRYVENGPKPVTVSCGEDGSFFIRVESAWLADHIQRFIEAVNSSKRVAPKSSTLPLK